MIKYLENKYIVFGFIISLVLIVFGQSYDYGFVMDDTIYITKNKVVNEMEWGNALTKSSTYGYSKTNDGAYRPVYLLSLLINKSIFGPEAKGYHIVQIVLYAALSVLVYIFCNSILKLSKVNSLLLSVVFAVHPVHVEVVCNIKSRDELLAGLFFVSSLITFYKSVSQQNNRLLVGSVLLSFLAIFSKESIMPCVLVFPVLYLMLNDESKDSVVKNTVRHSVWFVLPLIVMVVFRLFGLDNSFVENQHVVNPINNMLYSTDSVLDRFLTSLYYQWFYFKHQIAPYPLLHEYSLDTIKVQTVSSIGSYLGGVLILALSWAAYFAIKKKEYVLLLGLLIYVLSFLLTSNLFIRIPANVSDRFMFLPSIGTIVILGYLLNKVKYLKHVLVILGVLFCFSSINRVGDWKDELTLFSADVERSPEGARLNAHLASAYYTLSNEEGIAPLRKKRYLVESKTYFEKSKDIAPFSTPAMLYKIGNVHFRLQDYGAAKKFYTETIKKDSSNVQARINLGVACHKLGELDLAKNVLLEEYSIKDLISDNNVMILLSNLGMIHLKQGYYVEAKGYYEELLRRNDNRPDDWNSLGVIYTKISEPVNARDCFKKAYSLRPSDKAIESNFKAYDEYVKKLQRLGN